jgi:dTDP-4-amino-4,6-dideoxygalactose transaminase
MSENPAGRNAAEQDAAAIPVYRPRLPSAEALRPYMEVLDRTRWYSNHGPLERQLAARLSRLFGSAELITGMASSGTMALAGAILARAGRPSEGRPLGLCPGYTFTATAAAIEQCGYRLHIVDVDATSWSADPAKLMAHPELSRAGLVVPVAPYGRAVPQEPWRRFETLTGIPVVIDGAACIERLEADPTAHIGPIPVALSLHATKAFATGEGGAIVTTDSTLLLRSIQALNFGIMGTRRSDMAGTNGKMSEYHAAVGLAELDGWIQKRADFAKIAALYQKFAAPHGLGPRWVTTPAIASCYTLYEAADFAEARSVKAALATDAIEYRHWYGQGLHHEPYLTAVGRDPLPGVESLAPRLIGLPVAPDLPPAAIARIVAAIATAAKGPPA